MRSEYVSRFWATRTRTSSGTSDRVLAVAEAVAVTGVAVAGPVTVLLAWMLVVGHEEGVLSMMLLLLVVAVGPEGLLTPMLALLLSWVV